MNYLDLIKQALAIAEKYPWNEITKDNNIVIEHNDNFYAVEFNNNKCTIYPKVNNVYIYEHSLKTINEINNLYQLETYSRNIYHQLEFYSFEYSYPLNLLDDMKKLYQKLNITLNPNEKYISLIHKKCSGKLEVLEEENLEEFSLILSLLIKVLDLIDNKKEILLDKKIILYSHNELTLVKHSIFLVLLESRIHYPIYNLTLKKPKELKRRLIIDMRFLGPLEKEDFQIVLASYDDTVGKLLTPLGMKTVNPKHISMYLNSLFEKGIYKIVEVGNIELYEIIKRTLENYNVEVLLQENQELFDCIYEDYERIISYNNRIETKK